MKAEWELKTIGDVCRLLNGRAYKKPELLSHGKYPVLRVGNFFTNNNWYFSDLELPEDKYCDNGDLLYAWSASFGPRVWEGGKVIYHYHIWKVEPEAQQIDKNYLYYFFDWDKERIKNEQGAGTTMIHVSKTSMDARKIPLPPLEEQKRIVSILDEAFEGLDRARENAEANLKNARELFESVLQETLGSKYQVEREVTLGEVCILAQGLAINKTTKHLLVSKSSKPLLRIKDLRSGSVEQYVAEEGYPSGAEVSADDIIYTRTGQIGLVFRGFSGVLHNNCFSIRCINGLDQNYCFWWLQERNFRRQIVSLASRAAQPDITHKIFKAQEVTLPNEDNQKLAVVSIERAFDQMQKLQTTYQSKLQDISDLRQSLLQKAFAGELT